MRRGYLAVHIALFLYSGAFLSLLATARRVIPAPPLTVQPTANREPATNPLRVILSDSANDPYSHLGTRALFAPLIPRPPAPPPPPPPPPWHPPIKQVTASWRLVAILPGGTVQFEDNRTHEEWTMQRGEVRTVKYGKETAHIHLAEVNEDQFTIRLTTDFPGDDQQRTMSLF